MIVAHATTITVLDSDNSGALRRLLKFPPVEDVHVLVEKALRLRDPVVAQADYHAMIHQHNVQLQLQQQQLAQQRQQQRGQTDDSDGFDTYSIVANGLRLRNRCCCCVCLCVCVCVCVSVSECSTLLYSLTP